MVHLTYLYNSIRFLKYFQKQSSNQLTQCQCYARLKQINYCILYTSQKGLNTQSKCCLKDAIHQLTRRCCLLRLKAHLKTCVFSKLSTTEWVKLVIQWKKYFLNNISPTVRHFCNVLSLYFLWASCSSTSTDG